MLNKSTGNMYKWVTHTWSPIKGCKYDCSYCYTRYLNNLPWPWLSEKALRDNLGEGRTIFVCSQADMFGDWVQEEWVRAILEKCKEYDNTYLFQTKNPSRFYHFLGEYPPKRILGTTIESNREDALAKISKAPSPLIRATAMSMLPAKKEVTIEPIIDFDLGEMIILIGLAKPDFVAIGADSRGHGLPEPSEQKIRDLMNVLVCKGIDVKPKSNLRRIAPGLFSERDR